ncbi:DUF501 domain-containing protein [Haliea sp.]|uniref:DUF501 domain-containing protein n=1 Tax=Haliea sp. TaxID=1932666 RepID=UPI003526DACD
MTVSAKQEALVAELLGRKPRGLREVAVADTQGQPQVIRVASLVESTPFPTLFWLVDPALNYRIDREEASGLIARLQQQVDGDSALQEGMAADHAAHIRLRDAYLSAEERASLQRLGFVEVLRQRGIGGIADFQRIRCLHTWYAAHLVVPNTIGGLLDAHWAAGALASGET